MTTILRTSAVLIVVCFDVMSQARDFEAIKHAAEKGNVNAQTNLGHMYLNGQGVTQSNN
ncbi:MAG: hypothetical protein FWH25_01065 [Syntrophorhabdaceae bacterium]|nr:hypothetical protein [Syntrophorhabdaceae bacterium]